MTESSSKPTRSGKPARTRLSVNRGKDSDKPGRSTAGTPAADARKPGRIKPPRNNKPTPSSYQKKRSKKPSGTRALADADSQSAGRRSGPTQAGGKTGGKTGAKTGSKPQRGKLDPATIPDTERIQKVMARAGLGSRRKLEQSIAAGQVSINGKACTLGEQLQLGDRLEFNGVSYTAVLNETAPETLLYNKPVGVITTRNDPEGRKTVFDKVPPPLSGRWVAIGRLDINTSGLLILTTDGELANAMMHPSTGVDREYACRIHGQVTEDKLQRLRDGVELDDGMARFTDIARAGAGETNQWFQVTLMEGRQHEVRRLWASQSVEVSRLQRVRHGAVFLPKGLQRGEWQKLSPREHRVLREDVSLKPLSVELLLKKAGLSAKTQQSQSARQQKYQQQSHNQQNHLNRSGQKSGHRSTGAARPGKKTGGRKR